MSGKSRAVRCTHPLYVRESIEIYPGSLRERSIERLSEGSTDRQIDDDLRRSGLLVEEFVDDGRELSDFSKPNGKSIFWLLRRIMMEQGRIGDPVPGKELEAIAIAHGYFRISARFALRDAWKQGINRRFIRGIWIWATDGNSKGGEKYGIHYMLIGSNNVK